MTYSVECSETGNTIYAGTQSRHTFHIYGEDSKIKQGLKRSFILVDIIDFAQTEYITENGNHFPLYLEFDVIDVLRTKADVKCIISFQVYEDGEAFGVVRLWVDKPETNTKRKG